jgi:metal-responsive CopG/Arc/MetJ family transcriptional regulator
MVLTVRLDTELQRKLNELVRATGKTRSEIVREAVRRYEAAASDQRTAYERFADVIGVAHGGGGARARRSEEILREVLGRRRATR